MFMAKISKVSTSPTEDIKLYYKRKKRPWKLLMFNMYGKILLNLRSYSPYFLYARANAYSKRCGERLLVRFEDNGEGLRYDSFQPCEARDFYMDEEEIDELRRLRAEAKEEGLDTRDVKLEKEKDDEVW